MIPIRFINTPGGEDVVTEAPEGAILLYVADKAGVHISRGCKTGICGSCTTDLKDTSWTATAHNLAGHEGGRPGYQTVRTCSTRAQLLPGADELIVDVFRTKGGKGSDSTEENVERDADPMARFSDNWENEYVPNYKNKLKSEESADKRKTIQPRESKDGRDYGGIPPWEKIW